MAEKRRLQRVNKLVKDIITHILQNEINDTRISLITITEVKTSVDLKYAKVFYSIYAQEEERKKSVEVLEKATGFIQKKFAEEINLRYTPKLTFVYDTTGDKVQKLEKIFKRIKDEKII